MGFHDKSDLGGDHLEDRAPSELTSAVGPFLFGSDIYRVSGFGQAHPLSIPRVSTVMDLSQALGWLPASRFRRSPRAKPAALALWHDPDYVDALQAAEERGVALAFLELHV